jgi:hypothetical protein
MDKLRISNHKRSFHDPLTGSSMRSLIHSALGSLKFLLFTFLLLSLGRPMDAQSIQREKIISSIHQLTPTRQLKERFLHIDLIGFDILDSKKAPLAPSEFTFFLDDNLYIILYGKRGIPKKKLGPEHKFENFLVGLQHNVYGSFIRPKKTTILMGNQIVNTSPENWQFGGVYKIQLEFKILKFSQLGNYQLRFKPRKEALQSDMFRLKNVHISIEERKRKVQTILNFNNLDIVGIEFQDQDKRRILNKSQTLLPGTQFYVLVHAKRIRIPAEIPSSDSLSNYVAEFKHEKKGSFRSEETSVFRNQRLVDTVPEEWRFGEINIMRLRFTVPRSVRPGRYKLKIIQKNAVLPMIREIRIRGAWIMIGTEESRS